MPAIQVVKIDGCGVDGIIVADVIIVRLPCVFVTRYCFFFRVIFIFAQKHENQNGRRTSVMIIREPLGGRVSSTSP